jgi:hypothetical protein
MSTKPRQRFWLRRLLFFGGFFLLLFLGSLGVPENMQKTFGCGGEVGESSSEKVQKALGSADWQGFVDVSSQLQTHLYTFAGDNSNENYYAGDFADFDADGRIDRSLISRYGLLWNVAGGLMKPVSTQQLNESEDGSASLSGFVFGAEVGNDAVQWLDIDNDGDLDNIMAGTTSEHLVIQRNALGSAGSRFTKVFDYSGNKRKGLQIVNIDLERDGDGDFIVAHGRCLTQISSIPESGNEPNCASYMEPHFSVWVNDGYGNFSEESALRQIDLTVEHIKGLAVGDVDGDGDFDVMLKKGGWYKSSTGERIDQDVLLARNDGTGVFSVSSVLPAPLPGNYNIGGGFDQGTMLGDLDSDGDLDLLLCSQGRIGSHNKIKHGIFINDGSGNFSEQGSSLFDANGFVDPPGCIEDPSICPGQNCNCKYNLMGGNCKLLDVDYDGDLDLVNFYRNFGGYYSQGQRLNIFRNDFVQSGVAKLIYDNAHSLAFPGMSTAFGADIDFADLDGDGSYDLWIGNAADDVKILLNTFADPGGLPADVPRDVKVVSVSGDSVNLAWKAPPFASSARHYKLYRSVVAGLAQQDRELIKVIALSPFEDEGFSAPLSNFTTAQQLQDPDVQILAGSEEIQVNDGSVVQGMTYWYSLSHVGPENQESRLSAELRANIPVTSGVDSTPPRLKILSPGAEEWSAYPRLRISYEDERGVDLNSLQVSFDQPLGTGEFASGGIPAGTNLSNVFGYRDGHLYISAMLAQWFLPLSTTVHLNVEIADVNGNLATTERIFYVSHSLLSGLPVANLLTNQSAGEVPLALQFDASNSTDSDGILTRYEWYFPNAGPPQWGPVVNFTFAEPGIYQVILLVRDNDGGSASSSVTIQAYSADDPCDPNPCQNGGTCSASGEAFSCACAAGFSGNTCEINIDDCSPNPCQNDGTCSDGIDAYTCSCAAGFSGNECEINIDDCSPNPCQNGGTCSDGIDAYTCECTAGFSGNECEINIDDCSPNPCQNGGSCSDGIDAYTCSCAAGFSGDNCETNIDDCSPNPCQNGGSCSDGVDSYTCSCAAGFSGDECEINIDDCSPNPCQNGGTCSDGIDAYTCSCAAGFSGDNCEINIDDCSPNPCQNGGTCSDGVDAHTCNCVAGFSGDNCETNIDDCSPNPCQNGGTCSDGVDAYTCFCSDGFTGQNCEEEDSSSDPCATNPCQNGATCTSTNESYTCECTPGFSGDNCEINIDDCSLNPCQNGGSCSDGVNSYTCTCAAGFSGEDCSTNIDDCSPNPCQNGGSCSDGIDTYSCSCAAGFSGDNCEINIDECLQNPCQHGGSCSDGVNSYTCTCAAGFNGEDCNTNIDDCSPNPCQNSGTCSDGVDAYSCSCAAGFSGDNCAINIDDCSPNPCQNGGSCNDGVDAYTCICAAGFSGEDCSSNIDDCSPNPCQNGGTCSDGVGSYSCSCAAGFNGDTCEFNMDDCSPNPCQNSGSCSDGVNAYTCTCAAGFSGEKCAINIDDCSANPCQNGGICSDGVDAYTCTCAAGFSGESCTINIDDCSVNLCQNGGICIDGVESYTCQCPSGYAGIHCEQNLAGSEQPLIPLGQGESGETSAADVGAEPETKAKKDKGMGCAALQGPSRPLWILLALSFVVFRRRKRAERR